MSVFWEHLQRMARAQLFNGGYLAGPAISAERNQQAAQPAPSKRTSDGGKRLPHLQVATCR
jgi:hypothetical protein